jgi:hypothetical protein
MKFETVKHLDDEKFRRLTGVKRPTFDKMVTILEQSIKNRRVHSGRKKTQLGKFVTYDFGIY